ncbi:polyhydroxyalkanoate depolymerase [Paenalcaligenes niemegkensis]|uniref:polyhydroxyalkanoate depolymerase n=1 Tax=Paenalcaligenes niemegkensis TaxID=2895469 RepID=UPI001EE7ADDA|nr:polyhydroxyalkanoate depolymerase [Paenalcaligenes niemegkensis]MCQ9616904.1 polyhydroxyalkanoate depolymerase [Paenalcaligenes niemegkensis]
MLYHLHEFQRTMLAPFVALSNQSSTLFSHPYSPWSYTLLSKQLAASYELLYRLGKDYEKPAWNIPSVQVAGKTVTVAEQAVISMPFCNLVHFERVGVDDCAPKVLIVAPMSGHHATLLRDTVRTMLMDHDVYVTDWIDARMVALENGPFHLSDYVRYIEHFIETLGPAIHVMSVCQPTVPVLAALSVMAAKNMTSLPRSMIMMGGPIDPRESPTEVNSLATTKPYSWFKNNLIHRVPSRYAGAGRNVYPGFLQHAGFIAMNPNRHMHSHYDFYQHLVQGDDGDAEAHRRFYDEYNAVMDMPAEFYLDTIKIIFQEHRLPKGTWEIDGIVVRPQRIQNMSLFTIEGELDDISGAGQTRAAQKLCSGLDPERKTHYTALGSGHYGIFSGRRWRNQIYPKIKTFIADADQFSND